MFQDSEHVTRTHTVIILIKYSVKEKVLSDLTFNRNVVLNHVIVRQVPTCKDPELLCLTSYLKKSSKSQYQERSAH